MLTGGSMYLQIGFAKQVLTSLIFSSWSLKVANTKNAHGCRLSFFGVGDGG